ncbi:hypothetical protein C0995_014463 [Termitomyces sp. Mi166|nr:hypothetical protein C0995_014463 [Termitomyces sp. Mi166\
MDAKWCVKFEKTVTSWKHAICTEEQVKLMHFTKLASEVEAIRSTPMASEPETGASLLTVAGKHELYDDLDEKEKVQVLSKLPSMSKAFSALEETLGGKGKGKEKASAMADEEKFTLLTQWTSKLLAQLWPKPTGMMDDEGLEGGEVISVGNKANITLAYCKKQEQI